LKAEAVCAYTSNDGQQLESGVKIISQCSKRIFIFASFWTSWYFAARASGLSKVMMHVEDMSPETKLRLEEVMKGSGSRVMTKEAWLWELRSWMEANGQDEALVLLQGPAKTLEGVRHCFRQMRVDWSDRMCILEVETPREGRDEGELPGKRRKREASQGDGNYTTLWISHEMVGGVVDQKWKLRVNKVLRRSEIQQLQRPSRVIAQASDYLSTTERGIIVKTPKNGLRTKIRWKQRTLTLYTKSVFHQLDG
jgi:hypothetical protein